MRPHIVPFFVVALLVGLLAAPIPDARAMWSHDGLPVASTGLNYEPSIISDGSGGCIIAWHGGASADIFARRLASDGQVVMGWPADGPLTVCSAFGLQEYPVLVPDLSGGALIFWQDARSSSNYDIYGQHITGAGQVEVGWPGDGRVISAAANNQYAPVAAPDGQGGAIVAWYDSRNGAANYDIYAEHVTGGGALAWWGLHVCAAYKHQINPAIAADGNGGAFIAWQDYRKTNEYDIYVQHVDADGGLVKGWPPDGLGVCTAANSQFYPVLAGDGSGGVFVAWQDYRSGTDNDIYAQHLASDGTLETGWPADGWPVCQASNSQYYPVIASDLGTGAFVAWQDYRTGIDNDVYVQHLTSSCGLAAGWQEDGLLLSGAINGQFAPRITPDAAGGAFVAWHDSRNGSNDDIYAQQVSGAGQRNALWPNDGLPVCVAANSQEFPVAVTSGSGGAIVVWQDQRTGDRSTEAIYAQQALSTEQTGVKPTPALASGVGRGGPNPFRASIQFRLTLVEPAAVRADVIDIAGRHVKTLAARVFPAGSHALTWDGNTGAGGPAAPGVYLVRVRWPGFEKTQRIVRLR